MYSTERDFTIVSFITGTIAQLILPPLTRYSLIFSSTISQSFGVSPIRYIFTVYESLKSVSAYISGVAVIAPSPTLSGRLERSAANAGALPSIPVSIAAAIVSDTAFRFIISSSLFVMFSI